MSATAVGNRLKEPPALPGRALNWIDGKWMDAKPRAKSFDPAMGDAQFGNALKLKVGRENANRMLHVGRDSVSRSAAASFGS